MTSKHQMILGKLELKIRDKSILVFKLIGIRLGKSAWIPSRGTVAWPRGGFGQLPPPPTLTKIVLKISLKSMRK